MCCADNIGVSGHGHGHAGFRRQRIHVGGVGHPREPNDGDVQGLILVRATGGPPCHRQRVFGVDPHVVQPGQRPEDRSSGQVAKVLQGRRQQTRVAAELVDHPSGHECLILRTQEGQRAEHGCEHPAAVDVAHDHDGEACVAGQTHVHVVVRPQIDLSRAPRSLGDDDVEARAQIVERTKRGVSENGSVESSILRTTARRTVLP